MLEILSPTIGFEVGQVGKLPIINHGARSERLVEISKNDWIDYERAWSFRSSPLVSITSSKTIEQAFLVLQEKSRDLVREAKELEEKNNRDIIKAYGLQDEVSAEVPIEKITLTANPAYKYGVNLDRVELTKRYQLDLVSDLASYIVGCMMGRFSLDIPGLIYAHAGNEGFDPSRYETFPADDDGIVPITDEAWFDDDGANRIREFVRVVWGKDTEAENMAWLAESLGSKANESADDTIRRYLSRDFYKDHLQTYKKRPIYWLFSSGKHKAFEALVYLHRYNAGTLSRMRMEYVVPLQSRMQARIDNLDQDIQSSTSSAEQKRFQKQKDKLIKQLDELRRFDENLRHYADQRITLDLDDGVKVNYGKFGDLLAEVKAVTGRAPSKND